MCYISSLLGCALLSLIFFQRPQYRKTDNVNLLCRVEKLFQNEFHHSMKVNKTTEKFHGLHMPLTLHAQVLLQVYQLPQQNL